VVKKARTKECDCEATTLVDHHKLYLVLELPSFLYTSTFIIHRTLFGFLSHNDGKPVLRAPNLVTVSSVYLNLKYRDETLHHS